MENQVGFLDWIFGIPRVKEGRVSDIDIQKNRDRWRWIEEQMGIGKPSNLKLAILEADKIADNSLKLIYPSEEKMSERLKLAKDKFRDRQTYEDLWYCHKVRNSIAHETNYDLPSFEAVNILSKYHKIFLELGAL